MNFRSVLLLAASLLFATAHAQSHRFFATVAGGDLYVVDAQTCAVELKGSTGLGFGDIALTNAGVLYGIVGGEIHRIDTTDAGTTYIGPSTALGVSLVALNDTTLLVEYNEDLYSVSTIDASTTWMGTIGYAGTGDLTWYFGDLFLSTGDRLIRIALDGNGGIASVTPVSPPDPNMPTCEGLTTAMVVGDIGSSIVGVDLPDLVCFSPLNGAYQTLCTLNLPNGVTGAAAVPPLETPLIGCAEPSSAVPETVLAGTRMTVMDHRLHVDLSAADRFDEWTLLDATGRILAQGAIAGRSSFSVAVWNKGMCLLRLAGTSGSFVQRIVVPE